MAKLVEFEQICDMIVREDKSVDYNALLSEWFMSAAKEVYENILKDEAEAQEQNDQDDRLEQDKKDVEAEEFYDEQSLENSNDSDTNSDKVDTDNAEIADLKADFEKLKADFEALLSQQLDSPETNDIDGVESTDLDNTDIDGIKDASKIKESENDVHTATPEMIEYARNGLTTAAKNYFGENPTEDDIIDFYLDSSSTFEAFNEEFMDEIATKLGINSDDVDDDLMAELLRDAVESAKESLDLVSLANNKEEEDIEESFFDLEESLQLSLVPDPKLSDEKEIGNGGKITPNKTSPVPPHKPTAKGEISLEASPAVIRDTPHKGFDREVAPPVRSLPKTRYGNANPKLETVAANAYKDALLHSDKGFGNDSPQSPVAGSKKGK